jgi:hypothetical protein
MTSTVRVVIDENRVLSIVNEDVRDVFKAFGQRVRRRARASMTAQGSHTESQKRTGANYTKYYVDVTVWDKTPKGEPPRTREGFIKHYINAAMDGELGVIIGSEALSRHSTECLARLEYGDHPYMTPAYDTTLLELPEIWANVTGTT